MKHDDALTCPYGPPGSLAGEWNISRTKIKRTAKMRPDLDLEGILALRLGGAAHGVIGPVAVQPGDAPFDALAKTGKSAILDDRVVHMAQLAVADHNVARAVPARDVVGLPGPERGLVDRAIGGDGQVGIPEGAFLLLELRGDGRQ